MMGHATWPASIIGRLVIWSTALLVAILALFWMLFSSAVELRQQNGKEITQVPAVCP